MTDTPLALTLLGGFHVAVHGKPVTNFESNRVRALLAYLAVEVRGGSAPHDRAKLAGLLWPDHPEDVARTNLRHVLRRLRQSLADPADGSSFLVTSQQTIQLNPDSGVTVDVVQFVELLAQAEQCDHRTLAACPPCVERYRRAADLYRGEFLAGLTIADSDLFEGWVLIQRESLHRQALELFALLAALHEEQDETEQARRFAWRQIELEPWREEAHRQLMRLLAHSGQRAAALAQYVQCQKILADELGVEPDPETTALYEQIRTGALTPAVRVVQVVHESEQSENAAENGPTRPVATKISLLQALPTAPVALPDALASNPPPKPALFVGREDELAHLEHFLARARAGQGQVVFISGEAGSGKTALLQAFVRRSQQRDDSLVIAASICAAQTGAGDPFLPFLNIFEQLSGAVEAARQNALLNEESVMRLWQQTPLTLAHLVELAPDLVDHLVRAAALLHRAGAIATTEKGWLARFQERIVRLQAQGERTPTSQARLFSQVTDLLHRLAEHAPLLLILEDLQWADASSLSLLFHLTRHLDQRRLMIIGAYRPEEVTQGWEDKPHPLQAVLGECKRRFGDVWIDLGQTNANTRRAFVDALLDSEPNRLDPSFRQALFQRTEGQALFTLELLRHLQAQGDLQQDVDGRWTATDRLDWSSLPARVEGVIESRVERLTPPLRQALAVASVEGEEFTAEVIAGIQAIPAGELVRRFAQEGDRQHQLVSALSQVRVRAHTLSRYRFRHHLFQHYLYQRLDPAERGYLHEAIARQLETIYETESEQIAVQLAHHYAAAENVDKAVAYLLVAGDKAQLLSANVEAMGCFRHALALLSTVPTSTARKEQQLAALVALSKVLSAFKGFSDPEVGHALQQARTLCEQLEDATQLFPVLNGLERFHSQRGEFLLARALGEQLVGLAQQRPDLLARVEAHRALGVTLWYLGDFAPALAQIEQAMTFDDRQQQTAYLRLVGEDPMVNCLGYSAATLWFLGYPAAARSKLDEMLALAQRVGHPFSISYAHIWACWLYIFLQDAEAVRRHAEAVLALAKEQNFNQWVGLGLILRGWALAHQGESAAGIKELREGLALWEASGAQRSRHAYLGLLAAAYSQAGQPVDGLQAIDQGVAALSISGQFWEAELYRQQGELLLQENSGSNATAAERSFRRALEIAQRQGARSLELRAQVSLSRLWQRQGKVEPARRELATLYRWFGEGFDSPDLRTAAALLAALGEPDIGQVETGRLVLEAWSQADDPKLALDPSNSLERPPAPAPAQPTARSSRQDWGEAPAAPYFYGRQAELDLLKQWLLVEPRRVVIVLGIGGMGKSTLTAKAAKIMANEFEFVFWRSLVNAPPLASLVHEGLRFFGLQPVSPDDQLDQLVSFLRQHRCLLVLDNLESILEGGQVGRFRTGYEEYGRLITRLAQETHQSSLLLTSRERPQGTLRLAEDTGQICSLTLNGLGKVAGRALLKTRGLADKVDLVDTLVQRYSGNPLALKLVARTIQELFDGDIAGFLEDEAPIFDDVRTVLEEQFGRLSPLEREILLWLAIEREGVTLNALEQNLMQAPTRRDLIEALRALQRRSLLEKNEAGFTLQQVVTEFLTDNLVGEICREIEDEQTLQVASRSQLTRSFLNRFALLKAQASEYVRQSQVRMILDPVARRLLATLGKQQLKQRCQHWLERLRDQAPLAPGYAGGNLLNLLLHLEMDLHGCDFSRLVIWQAYLRGKSAMGVNLAGADLRHSLFSDSFDSVRAAVFSPDGRVLAVGTSGGEVRFWRSADFHPLGAVGGHSNVVRANAFSADGRLLASGSDDHTIRLWALDTESWQETGAISGRLLHMLHRHRDFVLAVAFHPDSRVVAGAGQDGLVSLWNVESGNLIAEWSAHRGGVLTLAFAATGRLLATGGGDHCVRIWDVTDGALVATFTGHTDKVTRLAFAAGDQQVVSSSDDQTVRVWDVESGICRHVLARHTHPVDSVAVHPDGVMVASGGYDRIIHIWNRESGQLLHTLVGHAGWIRSLAFSPNGANLVSTSSDHSIRLWDVAHRQPIQTFYGHSKLVKSLAFSPDGKTLICGGDDRAIHVWESDTGAHRRTLYGHTSLIWQVAVGLDGRTVASASSDGTVRIWRLDVGAAQSVLTGHLREVYTVRFFPHGRWLASGSGDGTVKIWDTQTGQLRQTMTGHQETVWTIAIDPSSQRLASGSQDTTICLWDANDGKELHRLEGHGDWVRALAFHPTGGLLASGGHDRQILLWDLATSQPTATLSGHTDWVRSVVFSPDGELLASSSDDGTVRLWRVADGETIHLLTGHTDRVPSVAFSPDGRSLASGSHDGTIRLWDLLSGGCRQVLAVPGPYAGMEISGVTGVSEAQLTALKSLGAVERRA
jgi:WD40 repeat protein/DNA-binding SARP family transcriptional activator/predicted ATPase